MFQQELFDFGRIHKGIGDRQHSQTVPVRFQPANMEGIGPLR
jgi:hypothetical protein